MHGTMHVMDQTGHTSVTWDIDRPEEVSMARDAFDRLIRAGVPTDVDQWGWSCGFYPRDHHGERAEGTAETFDQARAQFEAAWHAYLPGCTDADFTEYRSQRAWTRWKYEMQETGCKMPTQMPGLRSRCFCGAPIDAVTMERHVNAAHVAG